MGTIGMGISQWLDQHGINYVFADRNTAEKQNTVARLVVTPDIVIRDYKDANIVVSTNIYFNEIKGFLLNSGFSEQQILPYTLFVPQNVVWADLEDNIDWKLMQPSVALLAHWLDDGDQSVADYGAGQMYLKTFLRQGVSYYPIDYIKRFDETIVCDLNTGVFPKLETDVAVLNGVLEFLITAESLLRYVCRQTRKKVILSYMTADRFPNPEARRTSGYVSDLTEQQIIQLLKECGFGLLRKESDPLDPTDTIYLFVRDILRDRI